MLGQKQAVVQAVLNTLQERGLEYVMGGEVILKDVLTTEDKETIRTALFNQFRNGEITHKPEFQSKVDDDSELKAYVASLLNNWVRKEKDFNAGKQYVIQNPGSRAGSGDPQIKAMRALLNQYKAAGNDDAVAEIETAISNRQAEIKPVKTVEIDESKIPDSLRHLIPGNE